VARCLHGHSTRPSRSCDQAGSAVYVHCMGGLGRTGTFLACLLRHLGAEGDLVAVVRELYQPEAIESVEEHTFARTYRPQR
jgi:protein-tyrosine phosphatase